MKKLIALALALTFVFSFAACSKAPAATADGNEAKSEFAGQTLVMGSSCDFPPYEFVNDDGTYAGIDIDIATAVCEKLGAKLEVKDMDFNGIIAAVENKAVSFGMSGLTINDERKESVYFSTPYETAVQAILVLEDSKVASKDDLEGAKIGVQEGTTGADYCIEDFGQENVNEYKKYSLAIEALQKGMVDCVVVDGPVAKQFAAEIDGLKVLDTAYAEEEYAVAFNKADTALLEAFNAALAELEADGTIQVIYDKYAD